MPYKVLQRLGDALLVPAGCAHQVRHLRSSIHVAAGFVAPEHVSHSVRLTEQLRQLPLGHPRRVDELGVRAVLLHAAWACIGTLDESKRRDDMRRRAETERQRREAVKSRKQASGEVAGALPTSAAGGSFAASAASADPMQAAAARPTCLSEEEATAAGQLVAEALLL